LRERERERETEKEIEREKKREREKKIRRRERGGGIVRSLLQNASMYARKSGSKLHVMNE
jgi:hypothetical protein